MARQMLRPTSITRKSAGLTEASHINGAKFEPLIPDVNINHGWKIHGDFVKDINSYDDALAKIGIRKNGSAYEIADQSIWDSTADRLKKLGINTSTDSNNLMTISEGIIFKKNVELAPVSTNVVNGKLMITPAKFQSMHSNPLDTISMMEVFHENQTQFKASMMYGEGREFTGYAQSIENRDRLITALESRLGDRLEDVNPNILGGHQTEGATKLSQKITGRFTTEYTDIPNVGEAMDWSSQNPAGSKGEKAIENVMAKNPKMRPYIHTGVIDDQSAANLQKLTTDFPIFNEMLHGPSGYVSPYGTIEDTFSQQGYDYKTGKPVSNTPVNQGPSVNAAINTGAYEDGAEVAKNVTSDEPLKQSPPPKPKRGPGDLGKPSQVRTRPTVPMDDSKTKVVMQQVAADADPAAKAASQAKIVADDVATTAGKNMVEDVSKATARGRTLADNGLQTAKNLASGNAKGMGIAAAAALFGIGAVAMKRKSNEDIEQRLNRQRYGEQNR